VFYVPTLGPAQFRDIMSDTKLIEREGPSYNIAHFVPGERIGGDTYICANRTRLINTYVGVNLHNVAALCVPHEDLLALGLSFSNQLITGNHSNHIMFDVKNLSDKGIYLPLGALVARIYILYEGGSDDIDVSQRADNILMPDLSGIKDLVGKLNVQS
jgi:hypothetical protein